MVWAIFSPKDIKNDRKSFFVQKHKKILANSFFVSSDFFSAAADSAKIFCHKTFAESHSKQRLSRKTEISAGWLKAKLNCCGIFSSQYNKSLKVIAQAIRKALLYPIPATAILSLY